jgi:hypothetical protein
LNRASTLSVTRRACHSRPPCWESTRFRCGWWDREGWVGTSWSTRLSRGTTQEWRDAVRRRRQARMN